MFIRRHSTTRRSSTVKAAAALTSLLMMSSLTPIAQTQTTKGKPAQKSRITARNGKGVTERVDRRAQMLNRATALAMLREVGLRIRPKLNIAWSLPLSGPQLTTPSQDSDLPGTIAEVERQRKLLASNLELYLALVKAGFLTGPTSSLLEIPDPTGHRQTTFTFELIPEPGIEVVQSGNWTRVAVFTLVQSSITQVTGIYQEPGAATATVTATIAIEPTALYWRLKKVVEAVSANQTLADDSGYPALWANFPDVAQLYETDTQQRTFIRFDDGWRCCR